MEIQSMSTFETVRKIIAEQVNKNPEDISLEDRVLEDLGADSLDIVELSMSVEEEFGVKIGDEDMEKLRTVGDIVAFVDSKKSADAQ